MRLQRVPACVSIVFTRAFWGDLSQKLYILSNPRVFVSVVQIARAILRSANSVYEPERAVDFKRFCEVMLPRGVDPTLAEKVAAYMAKSFV